MRERSPAPPPTMARDVVVAGGDGTVSGVATSLIHHPDATLGILAMGSFNNMARGFGVPVTLDAALDVIGAGRTGRWTPAGWSGDTRAVHSSRRPVSALTPSASWQWRLSSAAAGGVPARGLVRGMRLRKTPMRVTLDGATYRTGSPAVTVSNGPYHGAGLRGLRRMPTRPMGSSTWPSSTG